MAKLNDESVLAAAKPYLQPGESITSWAVGVKQPNMLLIIALVAFAVLPGLIAVMLLTKNFLVVLTNKRLLVLQIKSPTNASVKQVTEYSLAELQKMEVRTSTGALFTHIQIRDGAKPFTAKFHRAYSKVNRPNSVAIAEAIESKQAA